MIYSETRKDLQIYLKRLGICIEHIWVITNLLTTDEESRELILYLLEIPIDTYMNHIEEADELILNKATQIHLSHEEK